MVSVVVFGFEWKVHGGIYMGVFGVLRSFWKKGEKGGGFHACTDC